MQEGSLTNLTISLSENNFFGRRTTVAVGMIMDQAAIAVGPIFIDKNFLGQHLDFRVRFDRILTRKALDMIALDGTRMATGDPGGIQDDGVLHTEGSSATVTLTKTLWSLASQWGWGTTLTYRDAVARSFFGTGLRVYDNPDTPTADFLPRESFVSSAGYAPAATRGRPVRRPPICRGRY